MAKLTSSCGRTFHLPREAVKQSRMLDDMLEDLSDSDEVELTLDVDGSVLEKVLTWCSWQASEGKVVGSAARAAWERQYAEISKEEIIEVIKAANFLNIESLLDLMCGKIADMLKGAAGPRSSHGLRWS